MAVFKSICVFLIFPDEAKADKFAPILAEALTGLLIALHLNDVRKLQNHRECRALVATDTGASPSGKAAGFDPAMRWFESSRPCHFSYAHSGMTQPAGIARVQDDRLYGERQPRSGPALLMSVA